MDTKNVVETDVLIVGGGPSGLATAISLANKFKQKNLNKKIMLIEKGSAIGSHILSGAVIKPAIFKQLLTKEEFDNIPFNTKVEDDKTVKLNEDGSYYELPFHPPYMNNSGNYIASLGEVCRYLANIAQEKGVEIYTGFAVEDAVYENGKIIGVKTKDTGINHHGEKMPNYQEGTTVLANVTVFAESAFGCKDTLKRVEYIQFQYPTADFSSNIQGICPVYLSSYTLGLDCIMILHYRNLNYRIAIGISQHFSIVLIAFAPHPDETKRPH